ncbi:isopeptide-forming domain-containing fimbrial protein [Collinsella sp. An2]|uniref:isopeptide-forming domain-containing fimbrial protein n=1 Tax=Collinsella sp. An2 TaxID=1965585 RepID=UPI0013020EC8|nr:isopeptide-forming domain-containing fimbrial protein [Collinsella sp. An2]
MLWSAYAAPGTAVIERVAENEFEPLGYEASIDFTDIEVIDGFQEVPDIGVYYDHRGIGDPGVGETIDPDDLYGQVTGTPGFALDGTDSSLKGRAALRYTGGTYGNDLYDAIVTFEDWNVLEPINGWESHWSYGFHDVFQPGIYISKDYKAQSDKDTGYQNFNIYTVGLDALQVSVEFVYAGTTSPFPAKGHMTCIDLDTLQAFTFGGAITGGRIVAENDHLTLERDDTYVQSADTALSVDFRHSPDQYKNGLVEVFYDTTKDANNLGTPIELYFYPAWYGDRGDTQAFFAMTSDFLTLPNPNENPSGQTDITKTADKTSGVSMGDHVEYTVDYQAHEQGVNCRLGYRYTALDIVDVLPAEMRYVDGSGKLLDGDGNDITEQAGVVVFEGDNEHPVENTVRFEFDRDYLSTMPMTGEHYRFVFAAELTEYPADGSLTVRNSSYALINNTGNVPSNNVDTELVKPELVVDKSADAYEYEVGDVVTYTVVYQQTAANAQARNTIVSDNVPEYLELIPDSVSATGVKDLPPVEVNANEWSIDFDKFNYGDELVVTYQARVRQSGVGKEVVNNAGIHANNAADADDPVEIYINTANMDISKDVDRYEGYVGASDQFPGYFEYTVRVSNTQAGTVANDVVITDDSLPDGMRLGRNNDGSLMIASITENGTTVEASWTGDRAEGTLSDISYRIGDDDHTHDQYTTVTPHWNLDPEGNGWRMTIDHLDYGVELTIVYRACPEDAVAGWEVVNKAGVEAGNSLPDDDTAKVWINQPHLVVEKTASNDSFTVNDEILYHVVVDNETPGTLGRNLVISDLAHTEGVELLRDTIKVYDSRGEDITDACTVTYKHSPQGGETFIVETHRNIVHSADERPLWEDGELKNVDGNNPLGVEGETQVSVEYRVKINDSELAGQTVDNTALAVTDEPNTQTTDDEVVDVKGPRLVVDKNSDQEVYQAGETGQYTLVVRQTREDVVAKQVVIVDKMDEAGLASIVEGSVAATGPDGESIDASATYITDEDTGDIVGFELETNTDLADEGTITVTYDVTMKTAGSILNNKVQASATNAIGAVDEHEVRIVDPYTQVALTKEADSNTHRIGETAVYTVTAAIADHPAKNVVIRDTSLPDTMPIDLRGIEVEVDERDVDNFQLDVDGNGFAVHLGDLDAGTVARVVYTAQVRDERLMGQSVVNTAMLTSDSLEDPLRADAYVTVPVDEPDVTLTKDVDRDQIHVGETVTYTIEAQVAEGTEGAKNVVIGDASLPDTMPIDMASIHAWLDGREIDPVTADISGNTFTIGFGDLRQLESVRVTYQATASDEGLAGTEVVNTATLTSDSLDDPLTDTATVKVVDETQTVLDKQASVDEAQVGDTITYTVTVVAGTNLTDAVITDSDLPRGVVIDEQSIELTVNGERIVAAPTMEGTGYTVQVGDLAAGDKVTLTYHAAVEEDVETTRAENTATLTSPDLAEPVADTETVTIAEPEQPGTQEPDDEPKEPDKPSQDEPEPEEPDDEKPSDESPEPSDDKTADPEEPTSSDDETPKASTPTSSKEPGKNLGKTGDVTAGIMPLVGAAVALAGAGGIYGYHRHRHRDDQDTWGIHHTS